MARPRAPSSTILATHVLSDSRRRLLILTVTAFFLVSVYLCTTRLFNMEFEREDFTHGGSSSSKSQDIQLSEADLPMSYGQYARPAIDDITLRNHLDDTLVPTADNKRRLIVIGDIHGCSKELEALLEEAKYDADSDHVIAAGDMVSKGPDSAGVVKHLMSIGASAVRGNHEDRVLLSRESLDLRTGLEEEVASAWTEQRTGVADHMALARSLGSEELGWLAALPVILSVDPLAMHVVHAGLVPGLRINHQDPWAVMNMRTLVYPKEDLRKKEHHKRDVSQAHSSVSRIEPTGSSISSHSNGTDNDSYDTKQNDDDDDYHDSIFIDGVNHDPDHDIAVPADNHMGKKWAKEWNKYQLLLKEKHRSRVFYGHDAKQGYQEGSYTYGLDSGCVKGKHLTAMVIEADPEMIHSDGLGSTDESRGDDAGFPGFRTTKYQVKCKKYV